MKIDWTKAPDWAQWLAVDADGDAYWFENEPTPDLSREMWDTDTGVVEQVPFERPKDFTRALYERSNLVSEETSMSYIVSPLTGVRIEDRVASTVVEITEFQWLNARELISMLDVNMVDWPRAKCIKLYRIMQPGIGATYAKRIVEAAWQERNSYDDA